MEEEIIAATKDADAILVEYGPISRTVMAALERCQVICCYGIGVDADQKDGLETLQQTWE